MKKISDFNNATEKYPVVYAGSATRPEYVAMPTTLQQQEGVAPLDTCPAQWWNAMWKLATRDINAFRDYVGDAFTEINNLLTKFGITLEDADSEQLYNFFHDDYVQDYISTALNTINGDLHIKGDLSVDGIGEEIISTELKVGANTIILRNDNPSALGNTELAGVVTENYDGNNNNNIIAIDKNGEARTGDIDIATRILYSNNGTNFYTDEDLTIPATIGANEEVRDTGNQTSGGVEIYEGITYSNDDTQPLMTRAEASQLPNGIALIWDAQNKKAVGGSSARSAVISTSTTVINNIPIVNNSSIKVMFTADISDTNATGGITPFEINYNGVSIPVKANKNGTLVDILAKEVQTNIWKYLQAYTTLELIYQSDYDGQGNPAFIILGNPILLSSSDYTIYANGLKAVYKEYDLTITGTQIVTGTIKAVKHGRYVTLILDNFTTASVVVAGGNREIINNLPNYLKPVNNYACGYFVSVDIQIRVEGSYVYIANINNPSTTSIGYGQITYLSANEDIE